MLESFLPANWRDLAASTGALKGLRKDKSAENLLRVLLLHLGCGQSLQETALRARRAELAAMTAAAVWNRLQKSSDGLRSLCVELFRERGWDLAGTGGVGIQIVSCDSAHIVPNTGRIRFSRTFMGEPEDTARLRDLAPCLGGPSGSDADSCLSRIISFLQ